MKKQAKKAEENTQAYIINFFLLIPTSNFCKCAQGAASAHAEIYHFWQF